MHTTCSRPPSSPPTTPIFVMLLPRPPTSTLFPSRRSSDLTSPVHGERRPCKPLGRSLSSEQVWGVGSHIPRGDRKSTRLNSSHSQISYAVFCLKKKTR